MRECEEPRMDKALAEAAQGSERERECRVSQVHGKGAVLCWWRRLDGS